MKIDATTIMDADGCTYALADFESRIEHVELPWGEMVENCVGLKRDEQAFVTSILVVTDTPAPAMPDLGTLVFVYNLTPFFAAPIAALMNRYHGLTTLQVLINRMRILVDPTASKRDLMTDGFHSGIVEPIHMRNNLGYSLRHEPTWSKGSGPYREPAVIQKQFTVEFQMLVKSPSGRIAPLWGER